MVGIFSVFSGLVAILSTWFGLVGIFSFSEMDWLLHFLLVSELDWLLHFLKCLDVFSV